MTGKTVAKYADVAMFEAAPIDASKGPEVFLLSCNNDPLGSIAAAALAYTGVFVDNLAEITDDQRRHYLAEVQKTALAMPLEAINLHFRIKGVTRGFTHQLVRQRTAAYSQESTRFAVKDTVPVGLPPSLQGTTSEWKHCSTADEVSRLPQAERWRSLWDQTVEHITLSYNALVDMGMPAEDARGLLPTNLLTQVNYFTNFRGLKDHSGMRLCTQAQFEWKQVWAQIIKSIRSYGIGQTYLVDEDLLNTGTKHTIIRPSSWQFDALADIFRPVCFYEGKCPFKADFDRSCSIRSRVDANAAVGRPSTEWEKPSLQNAPPGQKYDLYGNEVIHPIHPVEWLADPTAARR